MVAATAPGHPTIPVQLPCRSEQAAVVRSGDRLADRTTDTERGAAAPTGRAGATGGQATPAAADPAARFQSVHLPTIIVEWSCSVSWTV